MTATSDDPARELWRRQLVLSVLTIAVGGVAIRLMQLSVAREAAVSYFVLANRETVRSASYLVTMWPAALGIVGGAAVLTAALVHTYRVVTFTFRRGAS